jgi:membrane protease YdiL (CAAX protease family)
MAATGFQLFFLYFAVAFASMLLTRWATAEHAALQVDFEPLSQVTLCIMAGLILLIAPSLRRGAAALLAVPLPASRRLEVGLVTLLKLAIPLGLIGAAAIGGLLAGETLPGITDHVTADPDKLWARTTTPAMLAFSLVVASFIGPVLEEIYFRGFLYGAWERQWGWIPATLLTAAAFALNHPSTMVQTFLSSLLYVALLRRTGSLRACIYAHCAFNFLVSWPLFGHIIMTARPGDPLAWTTWSVEIACFAVMLVGIPAYLFLARRHFAPQPARS